MATKKNKSSFDTFGSIGELASILQSSTVKLGTISENIVYKQLLQNGYKNINDFGKKDPELDAKGKIIKKKGKKPTIVNDFLVNFDPTEKYVGQKIAFNYEGKQIQADILIYSNYVFYIYEIKSSTNFDTKKSPAEVESLFSNTISLQRLLFKQNSDHLKKCLVKGFICCLDAEDKQEIFTGFKNYITNNENMWANEDFKNIMTGQLTIIKNKDLINHNDMSLLLKTFVESDINGHTVFTNSVIRTYGIYVCTGQEFYTLFGLDFSNLQYQRLEEAKNTLSATIEEKCIGMDEETVKLIKTVRLQFLENDLRIKSLKNKMPTEQINLFD